MDTITLALFNGKTDNVPRLSVMTWEAFAAKLTKHAVRAQKDGPLFSPATYRPGTTRKNENVIEVTVLVLDFDSGIAPGPLMKRWKERGLAFVVYSSFQSETLAPRWRAVFPMTRPIPAEQWKPAWGYFAKDLGGGFLDISCKDESRMFYWPTVPPETKDQAFAFRQDGAPIDVDAALEAAQEAEEAEARKQSAEPSKRAQQTTQTAGTRPNTGQAVTRSDDDVIRDACGEDTKFRDLYAGNWQSYYKSHSEADSGFFGKCYWQAGRDTDQAERIFCSSQLYRPDKWQRDRARIIAYWEVTIHEGRGEGDFTPGSARPRTSAGSAAVVRMTLPSAPAIESEYDTFEAWYKAGQRLAKWKAKVDDQYRWIVARWVNAFVQDIEHGNKDNALRVIFGGSASTVRNWASVEAGWPEDERTSAPFWVHTELSGRPKEDRTRHMEEWFKTPCSRDDFRERIGAQPCKRPLKGWRKLKPLLDESLADDIEQTIWECGSGPVMTTIKRSLGYLRKQARETPAAIRPDEEEEETPDVDAYAEYAESVEEMETHADEMDYAEQPVEIPPSSSPVVTLGKNDAHFSRRVKNGGSPSTVETSGSHVVASARSPDCPYSDIGAALLLEGERAGYPAISWDAPDGLSSEGWSSGESAWRNRCRLADNRELTNAHAALARLTTLARPPDV